MERRSRGNLLTSICAPSRTTKFENPPPESAILILLRLSSGRQSDETIYSWSIETPQRGDGFPVPCRRNSIPVEHGVVPSARSFLGHRRRGGTHQQSHRASRRPRRGHLPAVVRPGGLSFSAAARVWAVDRLRRRCSAAASQGSATADRPCLMQRARRA